ncbi:uncharacterized protein BDV14DRAFT_197044 [Aspergillus stella-maris]|uniref:uncharacterized protein n=1 Tax=Aspergillus stella-maris TaxID=1810926 RepID=UPI003CCDF01F
MSLAEGNAWAQMKAKEQKEQEQHQTDADRGKHQDPPAEPPTVHKSSGLDYDSDLAVPMPKPRVPSRAESPASTTKSNVLTKPNVTKKRSTTEPPLSTQSTSKSDAAEKKKSKVASLRSKFSFRDIGKEYRKDIPPLSSMPKFGGGSASETKSASSDGESQYQETHNFNETKLYVPKSRNANDAPPKSAPPHISEFRDSSLDNSGDSITTCPSVETPRKISEDAQTEARSKQSLVHNTDDTQGAINSHLIQVQDRVSSQKDENNDLTIPSSSQMPPPLAPADAQDYSPSIYDQPKKTVTKASESSLRKRESLKSKKPLIVHSDHDKGKTLEEPADDPQRFMDPREPPALPVPALPRRSQARKARTNIATEDTQNNAGVTIHGGYAPPPPHPGYQNTVTLEQQLASHVESLHYHVSTAVNKITRTFENGSNWSTDQILRQADNMSDKFRALDDRVRTQGEDVRDLQPHLIHVQAQIAIARNEALLVEERLRGFVQEEMAKLKNELIGLLLSSTEAERGRDPGQDMRSDTLHPGAEGQSIPDKHYQQQYNGKSKQTSTGHEMPNNSSNHAKNSLAGNHQGSKSIPISEAKILTGTTSDQDIKSKGVPIPTAAFSTPEPHPDDTPIPSKREVPPNPGEELFGCPKAKTPQGHISNPVPFSMPIVPEGSGSRRSSLEGSKTPPAPERESARNPRNASSSEILKTPKKKGGMFSGFRRDKDKKGDGDNHSLGYRLQIRTPRRTKEARHKSFSSQEGQQSSDFKMPGPSKSHAMATTPSATPSLTTTTPLAAGTNIRREDSPSLVHPALRNSQQKQIMANREQFRLAHLNRQLQNTGTQQAGHSHPLRVSHSHQDFGNRGSSASTSLQRSNFHEQINLGYTPGVSFSTSSSIPSIQSERNYQSSMDYPNQSPPQRVEARRPQSFTHLVYPDLPPSMSDHGNGPSQFDGAQSYPDGNVTEAVNKKATSRKVTFI